jgi:hypothetical protein
MRLPGWALIPLVAVSALAAALFDHFGRLDLAVPTLFGAGMIGFAIASQWKSRQQPWFWMSVAVILALHVGVAIVPWTREWIPAVVLVPFGLVDLFVMLWIFSAVRRLISGSAPENSSSR